MQRIAMFLVVAGSLSACTSRGSSSILSEAGCHEESRQEIAMTADMCVGALEQASAAAPPAAAPAPPPAPPPTEPAPAPTASASAGEAPPRAPEVPAPPPEAPPPTAPSQPDAASLDPTKCEIDCNRACGGVPDSVCKRLDDKTVECAVVRLGDPCK